MSASVLRWLILLGCALTACAPSSTPAPTALPLPGSRLVVAWASAGELLAWRTGAGEGLRVATSDVILPLVAPDGAHIAFTRGPAGLADSLWVVKADGTDERQIAQAPAGAHIAQVAWLDARTLLFNTARQGGPASIPQDDLYRTTLTDDQATLWLEPGEGGNWSLSPDGRTLAVFSPGTYQAEPARITFITLDDEASRTAFSFPAVATGGHQPFYPSHGWTAESDALFLAVPIADALYEDLSAVADAPGVALWLVPVAEDISPRLLGTVRASAFGLPQWRADGRATLYWQRSPGTNDFALMVAGADGLDPAAIIRAGAESAGQAQWWSAEHLVYQLDGAWYVTAPGAQPERLTLEVMYQPLFLPDERFLFLTPRALAADGFALRLARRGQASQAVANVGPGLPVYDAVWLPAQPQ